jgi:hypothetical protein
MRLMPNFDLGKAIREDYNLRLLAKRSFEELITELLEPNTVYYDNIQKLFDYALNHLYLFPNIRLSDYDSIEDAISGYLYKWIQKYIDGHNQKPLESEINSIGEIDEALLQHLVVYFSRDCDDGESLALDAYKQHFILMGLENLNGRVLEEYLKTILEPIGWIWCAGEVYRAVDFCYILEDKSDILLQVKNKYNSENSSSSAIRDSTPITKWNRLNRPRKSNPTKPLDNWPELQKIVNCDDVNDALTENSYLKYIDDNSNIEFK